MAKISDSSSSCLHSNESSFFQKKDGYEKKLINVSLLKKKIGMHEWARLIWEQGLRKYIKHVPKASNRTFHLFQNLSNDTYLSEMEFFGTGLLSYERHGFAL
jgi:hypothetical protein